MTKEVLMGMMSYFDMVHGVTRKAVAKIPDDKLDWRPTSEVRTVKELVAHIYECERVFARGAKKGSLEEADFAQEGERVKALNTVQDLINYGQEAHQEAMEIAADLTEEDMRKTVKCFWGDMQPFILFSSAYDEHWHHRGQLYVYLRLLGIEPPNLYDYSK